MRTPSLSILRSKTDIIKGADPNAPTVQGEHKVDKWADNDIVDKEAQLPPLAPYRRFSNGTGSAGLDTSLTGQEILNGSGNESAYSRQASNVSLSRKSKIQMRATSASNIHDKPISGMRRRSKNDDGSSTDHFGVSSSRRVSQNDDALDEDARTVQSRADSTEKPTIFLYPRKSIVMGSSSSLRRTSVKSESSDRRTSAATDAGVATETVTITQPAATQVEEIVIKITLEAPSRVVSPLDVNSNFSRDMSVIPEEKSRPPSLVNTPSHVPAITPITAPNEPQVQNNPEYFHYLMHQQRHSSSNFIQKIDSSEIVWRTEENVIKMIGSYMLGDQIGKGSFGKVKEGICSERLQRVAIKIVNKKRLRKVTNGVESMIREIKLLRRLKHKNSICLMDVYCKVEDEDGHTGVFNWHSGIEEEPIRWTMEDGTEEDRKVEILKWYLVFEYCPLTLQTLMENTRLTMAMAHRLFTQLIEGLDYLHSRGVIRTCILLKRQASFPDAPLL